MMHSLTDHSIEELQKEVDETVSCTEECRAEVEKLLGMLITMNNLLRSYEEGLVKSHGN